MCATQLAVQLRCMPAGACAAVQDACSVVAWAGPSPALNDADPALCLLTLRIFLPMRPRGLSLMVMRQDIADAVLVSAAGPAEGNLAGMPDVMHPLQGTSHPALTSRWGGMHTLAALLCIWILCWLSVVSVG